ncbi:MAG: hypothetical protein AAF497_09050 [Planctomycetota bacterium]
MHSIHRAISSFVLLCLLGGIVDAQIASPTPPLRTLPRVRGALSTLRGNLSGDTERQKRWAEYLLLDEVGREIDKGTDADASVLNKSIEALSKTERPVDGELLGKLRSALRKWLDTPSDDDDAELSSEVADEVTGAAGALRKWTARSRARYRAWEDILNLRSIERAAKSPARAKKEDVQKYYERVLVESSDSDRSSYANLRRALESLKTELENPLEEDLAEQARAAKNQPMNLDSGRLTTARVVLQNRLNELESFLNTAKQGYREGWQEFLGWDDLKHELASGAEPRYGALATAFTKYDSGENGLELAPFFNVRNALEDYLEILQLTETGKNRLPTQRVNLQNSVLDLKNFLSTGGAEKEKAWKDYLELDKLDEEVRKSKPELKQLAAAFKRFSSDECGLDWPPFAKVRQNLGKYLELTKMAGGADANDRFADRVEKIAQTLQLHELDPSNDTAAQLIRDLGWMESTGLLPDIAGKVRGQYSRPNFYVALSGDFVTKQINDTRSDYQNINRNFEGSHITGSATTSANITGVLVPSDNGAVIDILLNGTTITRTVAQQRRVFVHSQGTTGLSATKRLYLNFQPVMASSLPSVGLMTSPANATASTYQQTLGVNVNRCVGRRLIGRVACRKADQSNPRAASQTSREAEQTTEEQLNREVNQMISGADQRMQDALARMNIDQEYLPDSMRMRSSSRKLYFDGLVTAKRYMGAPSNPPDVGAESDLTLQLHQSAVNNVMARLFGGIKIDPQRMADMLKERNIEVPAELQSSLSGGSDDEKSDDESDEKAAQDDDDWALTFDTLQPVTVAFSDGKVRIAIRGRRFEQGDQAIKEPLEISVTYRLRKSSTGDLEARRIGDIEVLFLESPGRLSTKQLAYKTFIKRKTSNLFTRTISTSQLPESNLTNQLRSLVLDQVEATRGWLALAFGLQNVSLDSLGGSNSSSTANAVPVEMVVPTVIR